MPRGKKKIAGAGDAVAAVTKATGIDKVATKIAKALGKEDCGCKENQAWLNSKWSFVNTEKGCMTVEQVAEYERYRDTYFTDKDGKVKNHTFKGGERNDLLDMIKLYNSVFNVNVKGCEGCGAGEYWKKLTGVYNRLKEESAKKAQKITQ